MLFKNVFFSVCYYIIFSVITSRNVPKNRPFFWDILQANYGKNYIITNKRKTHFLKGIGRTFMIMRLNFKKKIFFKIFYFLSRNGGYGGKINFEKNSKFFFSNQTSINKMYNQILNKNEIFFNIAQKTWL